MQNISQPSAIQTFPEFNICNQPLNVFILSVKIFYIANPGLNEFAEIILLKGLIICLTLGGLPVTIGQECVYDPE